MRGSYTGSMLPSQGREASSILVPRSKPTNNVIELHFAKIMNYTYVITGNLQPANLIQFLKINTEFYLKHVEFCIEGRAVMQITGSEIKLTFETEKDHSRDKLANLETLRNILIEQVRLVINVLGYVDSFYLDVYLMNIKCDEINLDSNFGIKGEYNIIKNDNEKNEEFNRIMNLFVSKDYSKYTWLKDVFFDFHNSIKYPSQTAQYCFRAIETIRCNYYEDITIVNDKTRREKGWDSLRLELNYSREDFKEIEKFGIPNRHGLYPVITYNERERIMNFVRQLIDRFLEQRLYSH